MSNTSPLIYIASAREDTARVEPVVDSLRTRGFTVSFDAAAVHGAGDYVQQSQQALREASALVVFVSQASVRSPWVEAETRTYQSLGARGGNRALIAVRLDDTPLPPSLARQSAIDAAGDTPTMTAAAIEQEIGRSLHIIFGGVDAPFDSEPSEWPATDPIPEAEAAATEAEAAQGKGIGDWPGAAEPSGAEANDESDPYESEPMLPDMSEDASDADRAPVIDEPVPAPAPAPTPAPPTDVAPPAPHPIAPSPRPSDPGGQAYPARQAPPQRVDEARAPSPAAPRPTLEQVTFTAYHPREMQPQQWQPLVVYLSLDTPATLALVSAAAAERLGGKRDQFRPGRAEKSAGLARGASLRIVPVAPECIFNPSHLDVTWQEDVQQHEFRMRAETAKSGQSVNGVVQIFQGIVLRAEVPFSVFVGQAPARLDSPEAYAQAIARAYRRIFASYSHQDMPVVESCESAARTMGDQYLRDVTLLQSGQEWDPRLIQAINDADIFQLFWSKRAATSPFVEREWRHALKLLPVRPNFIRPVYWTRQLYPTPPELNAMHFQPLSLSNLGWGWLRATWYDVRNR